jgi:hypothetical protein
MKPILPYVYRLTNRNTGEFYIGIRMKNKVRVEEDLGVEYFTSSRYVKPRFKEFETEIVAEFFDSDSAYWFEQSLIQENWKLAGILNKKYQRKRDGKNIFGHSEKCNTPEARAKISKALKCKPKTTEHNKKVGDAQRGRPHRLALCKPKTVSVSDSVLLAHENMRVKSNRFLSCIHSRSELYTNQIRKHNCNN